MFVGMFKKYLMLQENVFATNNHRPTFLYLKHFWKKYFYNYLCDGWDFRKDPHNHDNQFFWDKYIQKFRHTTHATVKIRSPSYNSEGSCNSAYVFQERVDLVLWTSDAKKSRQLNVDPLVQDNENNLQCQISYRHPSQKENLQNHISQ